MVMAAALLAVQATYVAVCLYLHDFKLARSVMSGRQGRQLRCGCSSQPGLGTAAGLDMVQRLDFSR